MSKFLQNLPPPKSWNRFHFYVSFFVFCLSSLPGYAQSDRERILNLRKDSNSALKVFDHAQFLSYLTDDVQITTGNGTLLKGMEKLRGYLAENVGNRIYFIRTSTEVEVNAQRGLAWETGTWKGYATGQEEKSIAGGKYAAQWTKTAEGWRIRSELFVALE